MHSLEELLAECLHTLEHAGPDALAELLDRHPAHAAELRRRIDQLAAMGLVEGRPRDLGPYELVRELGRGAQGVVWLAVDERLSRRVALKVLAPSFAVTETDLARFQREAEAASRLDHPGICSVFESGETQGSFFIAMRYVEGKTLAAYLAERRSGDSRSSGRQELHEVLAVIEGIARALHAAHEAGLVHRDLKPGNVMITPAGEPVVLDFGLARFAGEGTSGLTRTGDVLGTPAYMSPEQVEGASDVDRRSDVYSLGVVLFECATLRRPFEGATRDALYHAILTQPAPDPRTLDPKLPRDLGVVVRRALEKDPRHRFATALELALELERVRELRPIETRPAGALLRLRRWAQRNPTVATLGIAVLTVVTVALVAGAFLYERERAASRRADGRALSARALELAEVSPDLALLLAIEGAQRSPGLLANNALLGALAGCREERTLVCDPHAVHAAAFDAAGERVLTFSADRVARVWNATSGEELLTRALPAVPVRAVFDASGAAVAWVTEDGGVWLWRLHDNRMDSIADGQTSVRALSFGSSDEELLLVDGAGALNVFAISPSDSHSSRSSSDGLCVAAALLPNHGLLAAAFSDGRIEVRDLAAESARTTVRGKDGRVLDVGFDPSGTRLLGVFGSRGGEPGNDAVFVWDASTGDVLLELARPAFTLAGGGLDASGESFFTIETDDTVRWREVAGGTELFSLRGHTDAIATLACDSTGNRAVSASRDGTARIWSLNQQTDPLSLVGHTAGISPVSFAPDGSMLATAAEDGTARVWDAATGDVLAVLETHVHDTVYPARFSTDGERVLTASRDGFVRVFDARTGRELVRMPGSTLGVFCAAFDPAGERILSGSYDGTARVFDAVTGAEEHRLTGHTGAVVWVAFAPSGKLAATASEDGTARVWDVATGERVGTVRHGAAVYQVVFDHEGERLLTVSADGTARISAAADCSERLRLQGHEQPVFRAAFDPTGTRVATASFDGTARVWRAADGALVRTLTGHGDWLSWIEFSPDGAWIVTASNDRTARMWDATTGAEWLTLRGHDQAVTCATFSPDGTRIATCGGERALIWPAFPLARARERAPRAARPADRVRFP